MNKAGKTKKRQLPKIKFTAIDFKSNMDIIAMFIYYELNSNITDTTDYFKKEYKKISSIDFSNKTIDEISNILQCDLKNTWNKYMKNCEAKIQLKNSKSQNFPRPGGKGRVAHL